jgi:hypothetical protein
MSELRWQGKFIEQGTARSRIDALHANPALLRDSEANKLLFVITNGLPGQSAERLTYHTGSGLDDM